MDKKSQIGATIGRVELKTKKIFFMLETFHSSCPEMK